MSRHRGYLPVVDKIHVEGLMKEAVKQRDKCLRRRRRHLAKKEKTDAMLEKLLADIHGFYAGELRQILKS